MQAQYGKEVLGAVRLQEARKHQSEAKSILETAESLDDPEQKRRLKAEAKEEKQRYSQLKKLRWTLLTNGAKLSDEKTQHLQNILSDHSDLAVCYAMKEELCALFELRDPLAAYEGWKRWFDAAEASGIPALVKFAELKRSRLDGLAAHAVFPISTGKLEGFNNKIKVAKRMLSAAVVFGLFMTLMGALVTLLTPLVFGHLSPVAQGICRDLVLLVSLYMPLWVYSNVQFSIARAGGDTVMGAVVDGCVTLAVVIPGILLLARFTDWGPVAMYGALKLTDFVKITVAHLWLKKEKWVKNLTVQAA